MWYCLAVSCSVEDFSVFCVIIYGNDRLCGMVQLYHIV